MSERQEQLPEQRQERKVYTEKFKRDALRLAKECSSISQVARDLGIHESVLSRWKRQIEKGVENTFPGHGNP